MLSYIHYDNRREEAKHRILKLASVFYHLPSVCVSTPRIYPRSGYFLVIYNTGYTHDRFLFVFFVLFEWTPSQRKEMGIPIGILPHVREQNKRSYFPRPGQA